MRDLNYTYVFGPYQLQAAERRLLRDGQPVSLTPKAFDTLVMLVERAGHLVEKEELMSTLWPDSFVEEANIAQHIWTIRKTLGDPGNGGPFIETIPKKGFRFVAPVVKRTPEETETDVSSATISVTGSEAVRVWHLKRGLVGGIGLLSLCVVATLFWYFKHSPNVPLTEKDSILLADFVNTTGDAVFDGTLKQGLAIQLEQSPFLNIFPDERVRETLRLMNRSPDDRVTKEIAREICQRKGLKAYLAGSISSLGSQYVITLEADGAETGDTFAREQAQAGSKEQVLAVLGDMATKLREKLGESLASIQKYDAPIQEQITTSSLEALKAFSMGREAGLVWGRRDEMLSLTKRAVELDPNFALAWNRLMNIYVAQGEREQAIEAAQKAMVLSERVSEREKLAITGDYYFFITGELEKSIEAYELLTQIYPRDYFSWSLLTNRYIFVGQLEKAVEAQRRVIAVNQNRASYFDLQKALTRLNRFDEAKEVLDQALPQFPDAQFLHWGVYLIAFVKGDIATMQRQVDWAIAKSNGSDNLYAQGDTAAFAGQLRKSKEFFNRAIEIEQRRGLKGTAAESSALILVREAVSGNCQHVIDSANQSLASAHSNLALFRSAIALGLCGETAQAQSLIDEFARLYPKATVINAVWLPVMRAAIEIHRNNGTQAIQLLQPARSYFGADVAIDFGGGDALWPEYLRGLAYLNLKKGAEAAAEFQTILDHRGLVPIAIQYPLAQLGLARAYAFQGDTAKARAAYENFLALWKDADPDIPVLNEAKMEYEKLK